MVAEDEFLLSTVIQLCHKQQHTFKANKKEHFFRTIKQTGLLKQYFHAFFDNWWI